MDVAYQTGPNIDTYPCNQGDNQIWIYNSTIKTLQSKYTMEYLTFQPQLEIWAGPLSNGSQVVLLFNRGNNGSEPILLFNGVTLVLNKIIQLLFEIYGQNKILEYLLVNIHHLTLIIIHQ